MTDTSAVRKELSAHFTACKSSALAHITTMMNNLKSFKTVYTTPSHRTTQLKSFASEKFPTTLRMLDSACADITCMQRDAKAFGFDGEMSESKAVTAAREAAKMLFKKLLDEWELHQKDSWANDGKTVALTYVVGQNENISTAIDALRTSIQEMRKALTTHMDSKAFSARVLLVPKSPALSNIIEEIKTRNAANAKQKEVKAKQEVEEEEEEEEEEDDEEDEEEPSTSSSSEEAEETDESDESSSPLDYTSAAPLEEALPTRKILPRKRKTEAMQEMRAVFKAAKIATKELKKKVLKKRAEKTDDDDESTELEIDQDDIANYLHQAKNGVAVNGDGYDADDDDDDNNDDTIRQHFDDEAEEAGEDDEELNEDDEINDVDDEGNPIEGDECTAADDEHSEEDDNEEHTIEEQPQKKSVIKDHQDDDMVDEQQEEERTQDPPPQTLLPDDDPDPF